MAIKFGTSGWRDVIAEGFTFPNLRICVQAIAEQIFREKSHNKSIVVGYDTRFLSEKYAEEAARILSNNGLEVRLSKRDVPTPVVAYEIIHSGSAGGINITASHNPFDYNGLKYSTAWGGPALPETTHHIEGLCALIEEKGDAVKMEADDKRLADMLVKHLDFQPAYIKHLKTLIDENAFKGKGLKIVVDVQHGTAHGYLAEMLRELGCEVEVIKENRDVYFEGRGPDPSPEGLQALVAAVKKTKAQLGLACDGDADRFGVVDSNGDILTPNEILALLARYLCDSREWQGIVARSVMTTHALDAVARKYGLTLKETPVGFKHIGEIMKEADSITPSTEGEFVMGGEESGGFTMKGHVPEKDGILACLLVAEMVASTKKSLKTLTEDFHKEIGVFLSRRVNLKATPDIMFALKDWFTSKPPTEINGLHVHRIVEIDGYKFIFQGGSWLGVRFSGTEPVVRFYYEADSEKQLDVLAKAGESLLHKASQGALAGGKKKQPALH